MASNQSALTDAKYGYDIVVATTQASINATMKKYLSGLQGQDVYVIVVSQDDSDATNLISYADLLKQASGSDPFNIPNGATMDQNKDMANLDKAGFVAGIKLTLGLPRNFDRDKLNTIPDILDLHADAGSVGYRMLCADIKIAQLSYGRHGPKPWLAIAQNDQRNRAWTTTSLVNLILDGTNKNFSGLPQSTQNQLKNLDGSMFSIPQLLFDLNNAALSSLPDIEGLDEGSPAMNAFSSYFKDKYFKQMQASGQPVLSYTVVHTQPTSTLQLTDMNFHVSPLVHETDPKLTTLDYLCSTNKNPLSPGVNFTWDWVSASDAQQIDGIIAINRNTFANYLKDVLVTQARRQCFLPVVRCWLEKAGFEIWFSCSPDYNTSIDKDIKAEIKDINSNGDLIKISYSKQADDQAGLNGDSGAISLSCVYNCTVTTKGNKLEIDSDFTVHLFVRGLQNKNSADIVAKTYKDTFALAADGSGKMHATKTTDMQNHSGTDSVNAFSNFFADVNSVFNALKGIDYVGNSFDGTEISALDSFVFPGGKTFAFHNFSFSDKQDLLCGITYADPV